MTILIGHGAVSATAPANTIASSEAAQRAGVDMVEFNVRPRGSRLLVAHFAPQARRRGCLTLVRPCITSRSRASRTSS